MARRAVGPRRSDSLRTYVRTTRIIGGISVLVLSGAVAWDLADDDFWLHHTLFTGLVASLIVVAVTVAVLNELLERRQRERWSVLAQYALFDLVRAARLVWSSLLELTGLVPEGELDDEALAAASEAVLDTPELTRVFAASRWSSGNSSASSVYLPALPQACSSDETASSTTYSGSVSSPAMEASGTAPRNAARIMLSASSSRRADAWRRRRPNRSAPTTPGNVYAATAPPTHSPAVDCGASSIASHATATKLIPSPRDEIAKPGSSRRNTRLASTGR
jgi:hypothetical protein